MYVRRQGGGRGVRTGDYYRGFHVPCLGHHHGFNINGFDFLDLVQDLAICLGIERRLLKLHVFCQPENPATFRRRSLVLNCPIQHCIKVPAFVLHVEIWVR